VKAGQYKYLYNKIERLYNDLFNLINFFVQ
jgi:hypothetical protein